MLGHISIGQDWFRKHSNIERCLKNLKPLHHLDQNLIDFDKEKQNLSRSFTGYEGQFSATAKMLAGEDSMRTRCHEYVLLSNETNGLSRNKSSIPTCCSRTPKTWPRCSQSGSSRLFSLVSDDIELDKHNFTMNRLCINENEISSSDLVTKLKMHFGSREHGARAKSTRSSRKRLK